MTIKNRIVSIDDDAIDHSNGHTKSTNCEVIFDVNVLSTNFTKSKEGNIIFNIYYLLRSYYHYYKG